MGRSEKENELTAHNCGLLNHKIIKGCTIIYHSPIAQGNRQKILEVTQFRVYEIR